MAQIDKIRRAVEFLRTRKRAYQLVFNDSAAARRVLADLMDFCRATAPCYHDDPRKHAMLEGRREVWLRIEHHLQLGPDKLYAIFGETPTRPIQIQEVDDDAA